MESTFLRGGHWFVTSMKDPALLTHLGIRMSKGDADRRSLTNLHKREGEFLKQPPTEKKEHTRETWTLDPLSAQDADFYLICPKSSPLILILCRVFLDSEMERAKCGRRAKK